WSERMPISSFVVTSNVDGHFAAAGFWAWRVLEQHGSLQFDQCTRPCAERLWPSGQGTGAETLQIDPATLRAEGLLPACPNCGALLRPNVLMFGDGQWVAKRAEEQGQSYAEWLSQVRAQRL